MSDEQNKPWTFWELAVCVVLLFLLLPIVLIPVIWLLQNFYAPYVEWIVSHL